MNYFKRFTTTTLAMSISIAMVPSVYALDAMNEKEMSQTTGQGEFLTMQTIGPKDFDNPNPNVAFKRITLNAQLDINANLDKLRLGCDNSDLTSCDISIDKVSFTGQVPSLRTGYGGNPTKLQQQYGVQVGSLELGAIGRGSRVLQVTGIDGVYDPNKLQRDANGNIIGGLEKDTRDKVIDKEFPKFGTVEQKAAYTQGVQSTYFTPKDAGPITDFVMNKPFMEFAIQNPGSLTDRKIVGYRFGAHEVWGTMSTGQGPNIPGTNLAAPVGIWGPKDPNAIPVEGERFNDNNLQYLGSGEAAIDKLWVLMGFSAQSGVSYPRVSPENVKLFKSYVNYSVERGHTGVNSISGRMPVRLDNLNVNARVYRATLLGSQINPDGIARLDTHAQTAIVAGRLSRTDNSDFGRDLREAPNDSPNYEAGYLRNVFLGDTDTIYAENTHGKYVSNTALVGRAPSFKRATRAQLNGMIVRVHDTALNIGFGDKFNNQDIATKTFHKLEFGDDYNGNNRFDEGEGSKHFAFQYQTLDGLQWITTDKRLANFYDKYGTPDQAAADAARKELFAGGKNGKQNGYDWLSTRAGWWLESPLATVRNAYVPPGQTVAYGIPTKNDPILLDSLDLGARPVDNCYGKLTFC